MAAESGRLKYSTADLVSDSPNAQATPRPGRYDIDTSYSSVTFRTRHLFGIAPVHGSFAIRNGMIDVADPFTDSSIYTEIDTASFRTGNEQRDSNVRSARLLDVGRYPVIAFSSEGLDGPSLTGTLTVRNVSMPVSLSVNEFTVTPRWFNVHATTRIDRSEFGVTGYRGLAARYLDMTVEVRCVRN